MSGIAIFVKTPGLSPIKTRLAADIGQSNAEHWHQKAALAVAEVATAAKVGSVYFAVAEPEAIDHPLWASLPRLVQPKGDLGHRMERIHAELVERHGSGLLLGADTPQLEAIELQRASQWLAASDPRLVIGPASDGGFWTFGANRTLGRGRLSTIAYSQTDTRYLFEQSLQHFGAWLTLSNQTDVDDQQALVAVNEVLRHKKGLLPKQQALLDWASSNVG